MQNGKISTRIKEVHKTPYKEACEKFGTSYMYVYQIAAGTRVPVRGKGLEIKKWLEAYVAGTKQ